MIKNAIFDVDGVLRTIKILPLSEYLSDDLKAKYESRYKDVTVRQYFDKFFHNEIYNNFDLGKITVQELVNLICERFNEPEEVLSNVLQNRLSLDKNIFFQETYNLILKLKKEGYKLFILSNMGKDLSEMLKTIFSQYGFDDIIFSNEVHLLKPDPEIYKLAIKRFDIKPEESIFIDDRESNLLPFKNLGGKTFLYDNKNIAKSAQELDEYLNQNTSQLN